jgi:hypothetical protein
MATKYWDANGKKHRKMEEKQLKMMNGKKNSSMEGQKNKKKRVKE